MNSIRLRTDKKKEAPAGASSRWEFSSCSAADTVDAQGARGAAIRCTHAVRRRLVRRRAEAVEAEVVLNVEAQALVGVGAGDAAASVATDRAHRTHRGRTAAGAGAVIEAAAAFEAVVASAAGRVGRALGVAARVAADAARSAIGVRGALTRGRRGLLTETFHAGARACAGVGRAAGGGAMLVHADAACTAFA